MFNKYLHATLARHGFSKHWKYSRKPDISNPHPDRVYSRKILKKYYHKWGSSVKSFVVERFLRLGKKKNHNIFAFGFDPVEKRKLRRERRADGMISLKTQEGIRCASHMGCTLHKSRNTLVT